MNRAIGFLLKSGEIALVDEADAHLLVLGWTLRRRNRGAYVVRADTRHVPQFVGIQVLHRAVTGAAPHVIVDHINGNTLDNRRANLRIVTAEENARNLGPSQINSPAGAIGVGWHAGRGKWQASIRVAGKLKHLGLFVDVEAAKAARRIAEIELWGVQPRRRGVVS